MKPQDFHFSNLRKDEHILRIVHRHWFDIFVQYLPVLGILLLVFLSFLALPFIFSTYTSEASVPLFFFLQTFILIILWIYCFLIWTDYYLDIWVITTERVINIEQKGLFVRHISELKFAQVQDITTEVEGFFPTIFNYGDVFAQTAAEETRFAFHNVPNPYKIRAQLMEQHRKIEEGVTYGATYAKQHKNTKK